MLATMGKAGYGAFLFFACACFSMFLFVWFLIPETKGLALERMDDLFGVTELVRKLDEGNEEGRRHSGVGAVGRKDGEVFGESGSGSDKAQHVEITPIGVK